MLKRGEKQTRTLTFLGQRSSSALAVEEKRAMAKSAKGVMYFIFVMSVAAVEGWDRKSEE